jgi:hypothetical protein
MREIRQWRKTGKGWKMANGILLRYRFEGQGWKMEDGRWKMEDGFKI